MTEEALSSLLAQMTVREKLGQLLQLTPEYFGHQDDHTALTGPESIEPLPHSDRGYVGSVLNCTGAAQTRTIQQTHLNLDRNHIPLLFMADIIHGYQTIFPIPLALACSFSEQNAQTSARIAASESAAAGIHVTFSPMADLVRDPRWGRVMESSGEDPLLNCRMSAAAVRGYQQPSAQEPGVLAACVKHFAAYGAPEGGREYNTAELSSCAMEESYLPGYQAALQAGAPMVMAAFNTIEHIPATANIPLLRGLLRERWGFQGVIISDYNAVEELIAHGVAKDGRAAAACALNAGVDIEMMSTQYLTHGEDLLRSGKLQEEELDSAVLRVLRLKNSLGLFENPFPQPELSQEDARLSAMRHAQTARRIACECPVLLKNDHLALPLQPDECVGLTGPFASERHILGAWSAGQTEGISLWEGLSAQFPHSQLRLASCGSLGSLLDGMEDIAPLSEADLRKQLQDCQKVLVAVGEHPDDTGEGASKTNLRLSPRQEQLIHLLKAMGKTVIAVVFSGRPLELLPILSDCDAVLQAWFLGTESGSALAEILLGHVSPSGKLAMTFPRTVGQIPVYYAQLRTGRPVRDGLRTRYASRYLDCPNEPLFPFGYGLTYGTCQVSGLSVQNDCIQVQLCNTGSYPVTETVQLYTAQKTASIARPVKQLRNFRRVPIAPGEQIIVTFPNTQALYCYPRGGKQVFEPGSFSIMAGLDSAHLLCATQEMTQAHFDQLRKDAL